jgi:predicted dehydrogenase
MNQINIALIGAGVWGETHAVLFSKHPMARLVAICDLNI